MFTEWDTESEDLDAACWRCHAGDWTLDVWPDDDPGRWVWDVSWTGEYAGAETPYRMGHAATEDAAMQAAQNACVEMEAVRSAHPTHG